MDLPRRRRPAPAAIDITWVSCRGVKSSLPFHTPCLYATISVVSSSSAKTNPRRRHRVKTPTDRAGGENPEWDAPVRLYLPDAASPAPEPAGGGDEEAEEVLFVRFEVKADVAVLGDVHAASAAVPVPDLVADGRTRRVSYQMVGPDGRQPNGVVSFSYAFHERNGDDDGGQQSSSDGGSEPDTPPCCHTPAAAVALPSPTIAAAPRLYPAIEEWALTTEQPLVYPPLLKPFAVADTLYYPPAAPPPPVGPTSVYPPVTPVGPPASSVYPPGTETSSFRSVYPTTMVDKAAGSALYPTLDLAPVSYYPQLAPAYGVGWCGDRCLYG